VVSFNRLTSPELGPALPSLVRRRSVAERAKRQAWWARFADTRLHGIQTEVTPKKKRYTSSMIRSFFPHAPIIREDRNVQPATPASLCKNHSPTG